MYTKVNLNSSPDLNTKDRLFSWFEYQRQTYLMVSIEKRDFFSWFEYQGQTLNLNFAIYCNPNEWQRITNNLTNYACVDQTHVQVVKHINKLLNISSLP